MKLILSFIEKIIILMELKGKKRKKVELKERYNIIKMEQKIMNIKEIEKSKLKEKQISFVFNLLYYFKFTFKFYYITFFIQYIV